MNDDSFYSSLLSEFRRSFRESPRKIEVMMDSGNWKEAEMLAHSLKGTAGMVSAIHVAAAASELDVDLKIARNTGVPPGTIREKLHLVKQAMAYLMDTLNTLNIQD